MQLPKEMVDHINVVNWFSYQYPQLADDLHHFANERRCSVQQGRLLKRMGVKRGVADFFLAIPMNGYAGLWIELKVGKGKLSVEQSEFLARKNERGYIATACWGFEAAIETIKAYLKVFNTNSMQDEQKNLCNGKPIC